MKKKNFPIRDSEILYTVISGSRKSAFVFSCVIPPHAWPLSELSLFTLTFAQTGGNTHLHKQLFGIKFQIAI